VRARSSRFRVFGQRQGMATMAPNIRTHIHGNIAYTWKYRCVCMYVCVHYVPIYILGTQWTHTYTHIFPCIWYIACIHVRICMFSCKMVSVMYIRVCEIVCVWYIVMEMFTYICCNTVHTHKHTHSLHTWIIQILCLLPHLSGGYDE